VGGVLATLTLVATGACTQGRWDQDSLTGAEETIAPIVIQIAKGTAATLPAPYKWVALVGVFATEQVALRRQRDREATYVLIDQELAGERVVTMFRVDTTRKLRVAMNGEFVTDIEPKVIRIWVNPEVDSTIAITDADSGDPIFVEDEFRLLPRAKRAHYDLDAAEFGDPGQDPAFAAVMDVGIAGLAGTMRNGARIADWTDGVPSLAGCASLPDSAWRGGRLRASGDNFWRLGFPVLCVRTSDDRYGAITNTWNLSLRYVLWAKAGAPAG
jgi:hypothetical protein